MTAFKLASGAVVLWWCKRGHTFCSLNFGTSSDNLSLTSTLRLRSHRKRVLKFLVENKILDEHRFDLDTPAGGRLLNDLTNRLRNLLTALNNVLQNTSTNDVTQSSLRALDERLLDVADAEGGLVRRRDAVVNDRRELQRDVVLGHADLLGDFDDLDLDIDLDELLGEGVDVDETRIHGAREATELCYQANIALRHGLVGVRAAETAWDCAKGANDTAKGVDLGRVLRRGGVWRRGGHTIPPYQPWPSASASSGSITRA
jgi:hypothetical protein